MLGRRLTQERPEKGIGLTVLEEARQRMGESELHVSDGRERSASLIDEKRRAGSAFSSQSLEPPPQPRHPLGVGEHVVG